MEAIGVGLGGVSLLFQIFAGCIKGYQLFSEAKGLENDHQFFRVRFKTEQYRLLDWATIAQLTENDETLVINKASKSVLLEVLDQQHRLMLRFGRLDDRFRPLAKPLLYEVQDNDPSKDEVMEDINSLQDRFPHTNALLRKSLDFIHSTSKVPTRLRWAISDKAKIEDILTKLTALNDYLNQLLNNQQLQSLSSQHKRTNYQIMHLNNKVDHLCEIIQACLLTLPQPSTLQHPSTMLLENSNALEHRREADLANLAQFKALISAIDSASLTEDFRARLGLVDSVRQSQPLRLAGKEIELLQDSTPSTSRSSAWYKPSDASWHKVWIEWKSAQPGSAHSKNAKNDLGHRRTLSRFEALVELLREDDAARQFRTMRCLGYYVEKQSAAEPRYGFVFENPDGVDPALKPTSLMELISETRMPSLSVRVKLMRALAEFLEKLHAVNWLHKGLRSQSIIFFQEYSGDVDLTKPYLSGFDYSRPESADYMSESPPAVAAEDLYRHPSVQGGPREDVHGHGFKKYHDIYSLGVVLLEIAYWKPIYSILGFDSAQVVRPREVAGVKTQLLEGGYGGYVRSNLGDIVADIILTCLNGHSAFGIVESSRDKDGEAVAAMKLQARFFEVVVARLQQVLV
ncbi:hypothetical protein FZEAL_6762 [Fusarium zealandicum]|uniref:Protein kinase domain-containing protein n=1 Tax=Fusarium zealandicum TaxID=1053134 RepID=A0A8H4UHV2_9HYPO|nr:hypothetical protein FZEAL_6762 [Fusarium zealandicum]